METADGGTTPSLNDTSSKSKEEKPAAAVEASSTATDLKSPTEMTSTLPPKANGKGVSTVGEPKISPTAEERALESLSRDKNAEPSFISLLETSQKTNKETMMKKRIPQFHSLSTRQLQATSPNRRNQRLRWQ